VFLLHLSKLFINYFFNKQIFLKHDNSVLKTNRKIKSIPIHLKFIPKFQLIPIQVKEKEIEFHVEHRWFNIFQIYMGQHVHFILHCLRVVSFIILCKVFSY